MSSPPGSATRSMCGDGTACRRSPRSGCLPDSHAWEKSVRRSPMGSTPRSTSSLRLESGCARRPYDSTQSPGSAGCAPSASRATRCAGSAVSPSSPTGRSMPRAVVPSMTTPHDASEAGPTFVAEMRWTPITGPAIDTYLDALTAAMPPICLPDIPADDTIVRRRIVGAIYERFVDSTARGRLQSERVGPCRSRPSVGDDRCATAGISHAHRTEPAPANVATSGSRRLRAPR